jgi:hypothetical protein
MAFLRFPGEKPLEKFEDGQDVPGSRTFGAMSAKAPK